MHTRKEKTTTETQAIHEGLDGKQIRRQLNMRHGPSGAKITAHVTNKLQCTDSKK
jgi:hypothetical protein